MVGPWHRRLLVSLLSGDTLSNVGRCGGSLRSSAKSAQLLPTRLELSLVVHVATLWVNMGFEGSARSRVAPCGRLLRRWRAFYARPVTRTRSYHSLWVSSHRLTAATFSKWNTRSSQLPLPSNVSGRTSSLALLEEPASLTPPAAPGSASCSPGSAMDPANYATCNHVREQHVHCDSHSTDRGS